MDTDEPQWHSGVSAETGEAIDGMDTGEFADKLKAKHSMKVLQAKRGNRTKNQKRRKSDKLEKALAFAGRFESKTGKAGLSKQVRKRASGLWSKDEQSADL